MTKRPVWSQFHKFVSYTHACGPAHSDVILLSLQLKLSLCFGARLSESFSYVSHAFKALRFKHMAL